MGLHGGRSVVQRSAQLGHQAVTLTSTYVYHVFTVHEGDSANLFIRYTGGDETSGLNFTIDFESPIGTDHPFAANGVPTGATWAPQGDQLIATPGASVATGIRILIPQVVERVRVGVKYAGTSAAAPGSVSTALLPIGPH